MDDAFTKPDTKKRLKEFSLFYYWLIYLNRWSGLIMCPVLWETSKNYEMYFCAKEVYNLITSFNYKIIFSVWISNVLFYREVVKCVTMYVFGNGNE